MLEELIRLWQDRAFLREVSQTHPYLAPIVFVVLQALQVIVAPLPGEVTGFMAGFLFGAFWGFILSMCGIVLGSFVVFCLVSAFRRHFLKRYEIHPYYLKLKSLFRKYGLFGIFMLYLFPGFPKDLLNFLVPLMPISIKALLIISSLGRAPGTLALSIQGDVVYGGSPYRIILVSSAFLFAFLIFLFLRRQLEKYLNNSGFSL